MKHLMKTDFGQCRCLWCHGGRFTECPVTDEIREAVAAFASANGPRWKAALRKLWNSGKDEGALRQARNIIGPNKLDNVSQAALDRASDKKTARI